MHLCLNFSVLSERIVELLHRDPAVTVAVEFSHESVLLVIGHIDSEVSETVAELLEVNKLIIVLVEASQQVNHVVIHRGELGGSTLDLCDHILVRSLREDLTVILHVLLSVLVSRAQHKLETNEGNSTTNAEISFRVVLSGDGVILAFALHEATTNTARVLIADFVDLDGVITAIE